MYLVVVLLDLGDDVYELCSFVVLYDFDWR